MSDKKNKDVWLQGWREVSCQFMKIVDQQVEVGDTVGDGENRLVTVQKSNWVIVHRGHLIEWEKKFKWEHIVAIQLLYLFNPKSNKYIHRKSIAVFSNDEVIIYDNYQPYFRMHLPDHPFSTQEIQLYQTYYEQQHSLSFLVQGLQEVRKTEYLSDVSEQLLSFDNQKQQNIYITAFDCKDLLEQLNKHRVASQIVTVGKLWKDEGKTIEQLIIGTERGDLLIYNETATSIQHTHHLQHIPVAFTTLATWHYNLAIMVIYRTPHLTCVTRQQDSSILQQHTIPLQAPGVVIISYKDSVLVATQNNQVICINNRMQVNWKVDMPGRVVGVQSMNINNRQMKGLLVGLDDKRVLMLNQTQMVHTLYLPDHLAVLRYGVYGKEENSLLLFYHNKGIDLRILPRQFTFNLCHMSSVVQHVVPNKTALFVQDQVREQQDYQSIHQQYQQDMVKLKHRVGREYLKLLATGQEDNKDSYNRSEITKVIQLEVEVDGLGPRFLLRLLVENISSTHLLDLAVMCIYDTSVYSLQPPPVIPYLPPNQPLLYTFYVLALHNSSQSIHISICQHNTSTPLINCVVQMPPVQNIL